MAISKAVDFLFCEGQSCSASCLLPSNPLVCVFVFVFALFSGLNLPLTPSESNSVTKLSLEAGEEVVLSSLETRKLRSGD